MSEFLTIGFLTTFLSAAVRTAMPLMCAAIGEDVSEKAGLINVGIEAVMIGGAFFGFAGAYLTDSLLIGFLCGMLGGLVFSMLHAFLSIYMRQDQNVAGVALNLLATGITSYLFMLLVNAYGIPQIHTLSSIPIPGLCKIPLIGEALFNKDIVTYIVFLLIIAMIVFFRRTVWGMSLCSIGENPRAADTVGLPVYRIQYAAAAFNGIMGGLGGAYLLLGQLGVFYENITAGRGYIALAVVVFGKRNPLGIFLASLFFGAADALQFRMQALGITLPTQLFTGLPYLLTALSLLLVAKRNSDPAALGKPYIRTSR
ncbi:ABC transporter permease [Oscillibacter hominis]|uniref:ABC transporter permease n=1 Tax=Oscillibacter hominis TaxID=2763056 RepID=A0A7G9B1S1_9FIRM|nr:ABC transporter permease [Oscillibacter hominis]QNL43502.1 ABC transporter permease [Oscillibacter hominis]